MKKKIISEENKYIRWELNEMLFTRKNPITAGDREIIRSY